MLARLLAAGQLLNADPHDHDASPHQEPDDEVRAALASFGLHLDGAGARDQGDVVWIWPENLPAWGFWLRVQTQWRVGFSGKSGLDYAGVRVAMDLLGIKRQDRGELFGWVQAMECAALGVWAERRATVNA